MASIYIHDLIKKFGAYQAVNGIDLTIEDKEFMVLVGPSGCGKSTTLRMIAGLEEPTSGVIQIGDRVVNNVAARDRNIAMVFQSYALYPHMTVSDNIGFGLRMRGEAKPAIAAKIKEAASMLGIENLLDRLPKQLSGGQRQRVAMGRAIVRSPSVFLFDEPLSNLDAKLRVQMRMEIKRLHQKISTTTVYVTHDQVEAMTLGDRIVVMNGGNIEQIGTPSEIYASPATGFVASFVGSPAINLVPCELTAAGDNLFVVLPDGLKLEVPASRRARYRDKIGHDLLFGLRPEQLSDTLDGHPDAACYLDVFPSAVEPLGMDTLVYFPAGGKDLCARVSADRHVEVGEPLRLAANLEKMHLIDAATDRVI